MGKTRIEEEGLIMLNVAIYLSVIGTMGAMGLSIFAFKMHKIK